MPNPNSRREREEALLAIVRVTAQNDVDIGKRVESQMPDYESASRRQGESTLALADALEAAHEREDAIRALPRFDYRECDSSAEFLDADKLDAILDGEELKG